MFKKKTRKPGEVADFYLYTTISIKARADVVMDRFEQLAV